MALITWADNVAVLAPELGGTAIATEAQDLILAFVHETICVKEFGGEASELTKMARTYLAAHFGSLQKSAQAAGGGAKAGPVQSERAGDLARSYAIMNLSTLEAQRDTYLQTQYGKMFLALLRMSGAGLPRCV